MRIVHMLDPKFHLNVLLLAQFVTIYIYIYIFHKE